MTKTGQPAGAEEEGEEGEETGGGVVVRVEPGDIMLTRHAAHNDD